MHGLRGRQVGQAFVRCSGGCWWWKEGGVGGGAVGHGLWRGWEGQVVGWGVHLHLAGRCVGEAMQVSKISLCCSDQMTAYTSQRCCSSRQDCRATCTHDCCCMCRGTHCSGVALPTWGCQAPVQLVTCLVRGPCQLHRGCAVCNPPWPWHRVSALARSWSSRAYLPLPLRPASPRVHRVAA